MSTNLVWTFFSSSSWGKNFLSHQCCLLHIAGSHTTSSHITSSPPSTTLHEGTGAKRDEDPNSMLLLLLEADPLCRQARSHLFLGGFMPGQLPAAPGMTAAGKQTTWDRPATAPATCGGTLVGLPSADTWYLVIQLVTAPLLLRGKTETQERRHKWGTKGMWPYDGRTHRECSGLPLAACNQLVWWCLEKATASCEKTAGNRGKEMGKHRFTLRDEQLFLMF